MEYPQEFSQQARARVESEKIRAGRDFEQAKQAVQWTAEVEVLLREYVLRVFIAFVQQACKFGRNDTWSVDRIESESLEFLRLLTIDAYYSKGYNKSGHLLSEWVSHWNGSILSEIEREFEKSPLWKKYQDMLLRVAKYQAVERRTLPASPASTENRRAMVDAYIDEVFNETGKRITRTDIWRAVRYKSRTEFERWERNDKNKPNKTAHERFTRLLQEKPHLK